MALPGKLTVGLLDEDNPLKSFFRMKPILTEGADGFAPSDVDGRFLEEGFIRIVPDKNEMTMFKVRMRQLGRYCALDLKKHLGESDKIRPNKNYIFGGPEHNRFIVYSDVIGRVPPHRIAEVVQVDGGSVDGGPVDGGEIGDEIVVPLPMPGTVYVLVLAGDRLSGPWSWSEDGAGALRLAHAPNQPFLALPASAMDGKVMDVPIAGGGSVRLMYDLSAFHLAELTAQEVERIVEGGLFFAPPRPLSPIAERAAASGADAPRGAEPPARPGDAGAPWPPRGEPLPSRAIPPRFSLREQAMQAQSGLNPRRGRSLHEVVDEQWRKSRYDQLGHPVPGQASARPVASPIERAAQAVNEAWSLDEARAALLGELLKNDELREALCERLAVEPGAGAGADLEAQREALRREVDALSRGRDEAKSGLMSELAAANAAQLRAHQQRIEALQAELEANERAAGAAREAAELAGRMLSESVEALDERLKTAMVLQRIDALRGAGAASHPETCDPSAEALVAAMKDQLGAAGLSIGDGEAENLLACVASGSAVILSGPSGSGKTAAARALARALGLGGTNRFVQAREATDPAARALLHRADGLTPLLLLIDDFNTGDCAQRILDVMALQEQAAAQGAPLCLLLTCQDAPEGRPLPPRLMDRSFLVRLPGATPDAEWRPNPPAATAPSRAVSLESLRRIPATAPGVPEDVAARLDRLRAALAKLHYALDRRTLDELWAYCASAQRLMASAPPALLDLAVAQRAIPAMLASMDVDALHELPRLIVDLPRSLALMDQPLPLPPI